MSNDVLLEIRHLTKEFPGVKALDDIHLTVKKGEVHCILGENGAGKSTLMKCIIGMYKPTTGEIWFDGHLIEHNSVTKALESGISMIHQELSPVREKSVMENIWLGREPKNRFGLIDHKKMYDLTKSVLNRIDTDIDPKLLIKHLTVAKMQMIELAKAISYNAKLIIMDEPTSSLADKEVEQLYKIIRQLKSEGVSVIFISHKLDEIKEICDRITIFRDGQYVTDREVAETSTKEMIHLMVGRDITQLFPKQEVEIGPTRLSVQGLSDGKMFNNVSFDVHEGEILGFAGLVGAGRSEVMETLFGYRKHTAGQVFIHGKEVNISSPSDAIANKLAFLTEDRRKTGIFPLLSVNYNILSSSMDQYENKFKLLRPQRMKEDAEAYVETLKIKTTSGETAIMNLSGGNQQKVLIAKWLLTNPDILILDEPTRGIDVGAKAEIHRNISTMAYTGKSIIMVSSELPEVLGMSDRIVVMHEGKITGILENKGLTQEEILTYASGEKDDFPIEKVN
ncbi:sugar ABC transporter ATP-binding protein [Enterococcus rivorum]|uniref:Ribose/galactose/methyl galactoside import ATP-binding protein n=1 Tax=Enterococcus rivorum TaxID=762845 RepID=A0A1E5L0Q8_9ENTE|nr:sugar ABC transporter ATP-binding protein [Enterococcus rivorum]MBP2098474.1 methyl-galactoside transport system ATP-binding protein/inositol transport system ATP-binding protein [Enterococcus rivorum]OEH83675.1 D-xylose ABC transporter ATP-binding protein [Enterococcus rivorum]